MRIRAVVVLWVVRLLRHPHALSLALLAVAVAALGLWDSYDVTNDVSGSAAVLLGYMAWIIGAVMLGKAVADDMQRGYLARVRLSDVDVRVYMAGGLATGTAVSVALLTPAVLAILLFQTWDPRAIPWTPRDVAVSALALAVMAGSGGVVGIVLGLAGVPGQQGTAASIAVLVGTSFLGLPPYSALNFTAANASDLLGPAVALGIACIMTTSVLTTRWGRAHT